MRLLLEKIAHVTREEFDGNGQQDDSKYFLQHGDAALAQEALDTSGHL